MTDALDRIIAKQRTSDPAFREVYDRNRSRHELIARIVAARTVRGWSQRDLAAAADLKQPAIARLERGDIDPRWSTVVRVCQALELPLAVGSGDPSDRIAG